MDNAFDGTHFTGYVSFDKYCVGCNICILWNLLVSRSTSYI